MSNIESFESRLNAVKEDSHFMGYFKEGGMYDYFNDKQKENAIICEAFNLFPRATPETLTKEYMEALIEEIKARVQYDTSQGATLEREAHECFIKNLSEKKYSIDDVTVIAGLLVQLSKIKFSRIE